MSQISSSPSGLFENDLCLSMSTCSWENIVQTNPHINTYHIIVFTCVIISPSYPVISPSSITHHILSVSCAPADVCEVTMMVSKKWDEKLQDLAEPGG